MLANLLLDHRYLSEITMELIINSKKLKLSCRLDFNHHFSLKCLDFVDSNITQTLTGWIYFLQFPVTDRVARSFSGVFI